MTKGAGSTNEGERTRQLMGRAWKWATNTGASTLGFQHGCL